MKRNVISAVIIVLASLLGNALAEPPDSAGIVTRGDYTWADFYVDEESGLLVVLGVDIEDWCAAEVPFDVIYYSDKFLSNPPRINTLEKADVTTSVWDFTEFDCDLFTSVDPLATGIARLLYHDNDLFAPWNCELKNNANAFGLKVNGTLYSPSGEAMQFNMKWWGLYECEVDEFVFLNIKAKLTG